MFASVRVAAGAASAEFPGETVGQVVAAACGQYGEGFASLVQACRIWLNGEPAHLDDRVVETDEVAILPPVSGG
jgi:molybdopterin converting factor small subunit